MVKEQQMIFKFRSAMVIALLVLASSAFSQASGFNFTLEYGHRLVDRDPPSRFTSAVGLGLAYQQDFSNRFGAGLDFFWGGDSEGAQSFEGIYSAKYFFTDNSSTAPYIGSFIGVQSLKDSYSEIIPLGNGYTDYNYVEVKKLQVPVGLRAGLRGGLDGYFGELFVQAGFAIGSGDFYVSNGKQVKSSPLFFGVGLSFLGFGWDH